MHVQVTAPLLTGADATNWRVDPATSGAGLFFDLASHCFDLLDFLVGPITRVSGYAINTAGAYRAEDVTVAAFRIRRWSRRHRRLEFQRDREDPTP